jgi:hypothetical protein
MHTRAMFHTLVVFLKKWALTKNISVRKINANKPANGHQTINDVN